MDSNRPTAVPSIGVSLQSLPLQNNCALRPFPPGRPYALMDSVIGDFARRRIPFFLRGGRGFLASSAYA
ncbi:MAG: hypothetical protein KF722_04860 [Nitrospira sp.]|nr:hypothetical protein [Nitrospira sp.]